MGVRNVLVDGVQDFLLHLADGVAVEDLHLDLWAFLILWMDTVHHLLQKHQRGKSVSKIPLLKVSWVSNERNILSYILCIYCKLLAEVGWLSC